MHRVDATFGWRSSIWTPVFLQTPSMHISMPKPINEAFGWNCFCNYASPEMTKPPEGGLSPQELLAKPDGRGVSCIASVPKTPDGNDFVAIALGPSGRFLAFSKV